VQLNVDREGRPWVKREGWVAGKGKQKRFVWWNGLNRRLFDDRRNYRRAVIQTKRVVGVEELEGGGEMGARSPS
jgi:hypothetical protein